MNPITVVDGVAPAWAPQWLAAIWVPLAAHPLLLAGSIVAAGLLAAFLLRSFLLFWGMKVAGRTNTELDDKLIRLLAGMAVSVVAYLSLVAAIQVLPLGDSVVSIASRVLMSLLVLHLMRGGLKASHLVLLALSRFRDRFPGVEERTIPLFDLVVTVLIVGAAAYILLHLWNIDPTPWLASAGIIGIAVGFAAKDTLANLFAGFFIIADAPYKLGDYVVLDTGERGEITRVGIRSTRMLTRDDVEIIIPNSVMAVTKIVNESGGRWVKFRIRLKVGVAYGSDPQQVVNILEELARGHATVCHDPEPRVRMRGFGDSSLDFELLCWVEHPAERGLVTHELYMAIYRAFAEAGIEIPFPQRDVWLRRPAQAAPDPT